MIDLDKLDALAEKAAPETKGRWRYRRCDFGQGPDPDYSYVEWGERDAGYGTAALSPKMARYLAALDPSTVRELIRLARVAIDPPCRWCGQPKSIHGTDGRVLPDGCEWDMQTTFYAP